MTRHPGGRPPTRGVAQTERLQIRLTRQERQEIREARGTLPEGPWIIEAALRRARGQ